jgi:hypothetical protein
MKNLLFVALLILSSQSSYTQIIFDLSDKNSTTETINLNTVQSVLFKNLTYQGVKNEQYNFIIEMTEEEIPAIPSSLKTAADKDECASIDTVLKKVFSSNKLIYRNTDDETEISKCLKNLEKVKSKLDKVKDKACIEQINSLIEISTYSKQLLFDLKNNQTISIKVVKKYTTQKTKIDTTIIWTKTFKTPLKSPWHIMYGFTFVPNLMNPEKTYFCKADTSGKLFTITPLNNQKKDFWKNISPTIMIQWAPMTKYSFTKHAWRALFSNEFYQIGFVGGLSLNFASDASVVNIMAGPSFVIADNISLSGGVVFTQKNVLNGKFKEGDVIKQDLDFAMLHEKKYMFEWFLSMAIRFDTNPFAKKEEKK